MKKKLHITAMCLAAVAVLIVIFPFRNATFKMPGKVDSSASLGPTFILSNPSKASIYEAVWGSRLKNPEELSYSMAYQSEIDYGRTLLLMLPFAIGATALLIWMRKAQD